MLGGHARVVLVPVLVPVLVLALALALALAPRLILLLLRSAFICFDL
jgi:hypothetical protein